MLGILLVTLALGLYDGRKYVDAWLFQFLPPTLGIAYVFGYFPELLSHITGRLSGVVYIFGYVSAVVTVLHGPLRQNRPWQELGLKRGFVEDFKRVWYYFAMNFGSLQGISAVGGLLAAALVLTLMEEVVFRVAIQEWLSWFIGTPAAILIASVIFGLVHAVGTSGSLLIVLSDVAGVAIDGVFLGIIYAKTHNVAVTWATHYVADVVGLLSLVFIF